jgi:hypothetical protein
MFFVLAACPYQIENKDFKKSEVSSCVKIFCVILEFREGRSADQKHLSAAVSSKAIPDRIGLVGFPHVVEIVWVFCASEEQRDWGSDSIGKSVGANQGQTD